MSAWLTIEQGEGMPPICDLVDGQPVTIGRHPCNTIVLRDELASRWHAVLLPEGDRWLISNVGSPVNSTCVNGQRITCPIELVDGQEIVIGDSHLRFGTGSDPGKHEVGTGHPELPLTLLHPDELTALYGFLARSLQESDPRQLIRCALEIIQKQTRADATGFLGLDAEDPLPRMLCPDKAQVDVQLSRQLTQRVQQEERAVWLAGGAEGPLPESLGGFSDAICVPLWAAGTALGALHVYKSSGQFTERSLQFSEVLGGNLTGRLQNLRTLRRLEAENMRLRRRAGTAEELIGASAEMKKLRQIIAQVSPRSSTVLIRGESGVGKELVAQALHRQSPRRWGPLVVVNCAAFTTTLLEAELFGHCKGAFTGADRDRPGLFQQADEGTLFLDEIGELPAECQAKLLRVIEGKGFRPVGATAEVTPDVRIIAATHRDLEAEIQAGRFRQDLYFRLQVIQIPVPPLREHPEDIEPLAQHFLDQLGKEYRRSVRLSEAALRLLRSCAWPGNVRQLWAVLENAVAMSDQDLLDADDLLLPTARAVSLLPTLRLEDLEGWAVRQALQQSQGNVTQAARLLGVVRDTLASKMKKLSITRENL